MERGTVLGAQAFTALIPYLVVASALVPRSENESFADTLIERFDLEGRAADGVRALFATAGEVESGITFIGIAVLLVTVVSFARALQNTYERSYGLEPSGVAGVPHSLLWIGALALWLSLVSIQDEIQDWLGPVLRRDRLARLRVRALAVDADDPARPARGHAPAGAGGGGVGRADDRPRLCLGDLHADPHRSRRAALWPDRDRFLAAGLAAHAVAGDRGGRRGRRRAERGHGQRRERTGEA